MGVQGLWELLAPVGRRVSVETLAGKRLAIDASIWIVQFMKAMRDERGDMVMNAHLIGFFRRICKLLYLRTKPVFVFDGGTPALKRRTVIARRRQRENAQAKIRKTAEKLLVNQLKAMRLKEVAKDLENQRRQQTSDPKGNKRVTGESVQADMGNDVGSSCFEQEKLDKRLSASMEAEQGGSLASDLSAPSKGEGTIEDIQIVLGKRVTLDGSGHVNEVWSDAQRSDMASLRLDQEKLDEMLAASIAAEEGGNLTNNASTSGVRILSEEEDSDEDEKMLLPEMNGNFDPAVLASLPPSMQLDLLVQMRERLMAENRQKYQRVKKAPEKFSELQIQAYLKTVAFRREIDEVQKAASGRGVAGVQTSRIASEANREFIFSSSFTGDKQALASAREEGNGEKQQNTSKHPLPESTRSAASTSKSDATVEFDPDEPRNPDDNIEIYMDERGRFRIRNRHMGIRMTRDIQRNLDLMKEKERSITTTANKVGIVESMSNEEATDTCKDILNGDQFSPGGEGESNDQNQQSMLKKGSSIEISFEEDAENKILDDDDDIFTQLAAGVPVSISSADGNHKKQDSPKTSGSDWEEMPIERSTNGFQGDYSSNINPIPQEGNGSDDSEVEWEETPQIGLRNSAADEIGKEVSKGHLEEEADLQEAIRRSLLDLNGERSKSLSSEPEDSKKSGNALGIENHRDGVDLVSDNATQQNELFCETSDGVEETEMENLGRTAISKATGSFDEHPIAAVVHKSDDQVEGISEAFDMHVSDHTSEVSTVPKRLSRDSFHGLDGVSDEMPDAPTVDENKSDSVVEPSVQASDKKNNIEAESSIMVDNVRSSFEPGAQNLTTEKMDSLNPAVESSEKKSSYDVDTDQISTGVMDDINVHEFTSAELEEEMLNLDKEYMSLGDEQRRLERNAESVTSEMFAECQELLQIFGLPYIIAPMEAEAQCAYMELSGLVDGVVTDDSDVFLFGARSVYKNIFDDRKYVETYFMKDIEKELGLTREKLIRTALLLGSDYTEGVSGIGIVNAIEVVNAFPEEDGLQKFREWVESPDPTILGKADVQAGSSVKKWGSAAGSCDMKSTSGADNMQDIKQIFMDKHRNVSKNWHIPSTFPSEAVISAYSNPQVDRSTEHFSWGKPDLLVLRKLCWEKFGWNSQKTDDLLLPVLKEYEKREIQLRMEAFYTFNERFAKIRSKRIKKAVKGITGTQSSELTDDTPGEASKSRKKRRVSPETGGNRSDKDPINTEEVVGSTKKVTAKQSRKQGNQEKQNSETREGNKSGRGRGRGRGRAQRKGRGKVQKGIGPEPSESSSDDDARGNDRRELHDADSEPPQKIRRSTRARNRVSYNVDDLENDDAGESPSTRELCNEQSEEDLFGAEDKHGGTCADPDRSKQCEASDISFKDGLSEDYLQMGGGFCADEAKTEQTSTFHGSDLYSENKSSDEYFVTGGGFCVDESETAKGQENDDFSTGIGSPDKVDDEIGPDESTSVSNIDLDGLQNQQKKDAFDAELNLDHQTKRDDQHSSYLRVSVETGSGTSSAGALSAMPFLKKKRRKS